MEHILIHPGDNVAVDPETGHKYAVRRIEAGEAVFKYGFTIGTATQPIEKNAHVHTHNLKTALTGGEQLAYEPTDAAFPALPPETISAFVRKNGEIGVRNDVWIVNTVGCVNSAALAVSRETGAFAFPHPFGCSQLGGDLERTLQTLCSLIRHPNAGGVLALGLGCENGNLEEIKKRLGTYDEERIRFLNAQDCADEIGEGIRIVRALQAIAANDRRTCVPVSRLKLGLKCGGSDGMSGVTANPLVGRVADRLTAMGGAAALTEVPEMFGAEEPLLSRCVSREVFDKAAAMIDRWKRYYLSHNQPVSENPSPGNRAGGITTLEEKSLGCVQKGGHAPVTAVLGTGETVCGPGLQLVDGPGNDPVAITNLTAAGCHLILFTTGRGTPLGAPVPTLKIATNTALYCKKPGWLDFDAQTGDTDALWDLLKETANGRRTKNEENGDRQIAIMKDGVIL